MFFFQQRFCCSCGHLRSEFLEIYGTKVCADCYEQLEASKSDQPLLLSNGKPVVSPFLYTPRVRSLILRAKVSGNLWALHFTTIALLEGCCLPQQPVQLVISPAASLWSRCLGRTDLAAHVASKVAARLGAIWYPTPFHHGWTLRKRSSLARNQEHSAKPPAPKLARGQMWRQRLASKAGASPTVLVVDDVVTTGYSLQKVAEEVLAACPQATVFYAVIATSRGRDFSN